MAASSYGLRAYPRRRIRSRGHIGEARWTGLVRRIALQVRLDGRLATSWIFGGFRGAYRDSGGSFYEVSYSDRPEGLVLKLPSGSVIHFRDRDRLTFRRPQGVLVFRLARNRIAGLTYTPNPIRANWLELDR